MKYFIVIFVLLFGVFSLNGCAYIMDIPKNIWGSSTLALENARVDALQKEFKCEFNACFDAVLSLTKAYVPPKTIEEEDEEEEEEREDTISVFNGFMLFLKDRAKKHIVVMGVPKTIRTTEVGIFFTELDNAVRVEVSSLSDNAKRIAAEIIFKALGKRYEEISS